MKPPLTTACGLATLLGLLATALLPVFLCAQETTLRQQRGSASLTFHAPAKDGHLHLRLSDLLPFEVEATAQHVEVSKEITRSPGWLVHKSTSPRWFQTSDGRKMWIRTFWLEPLAPGELPLKLEPWKFQSERGEWQPIAWDEVKVHVQTVVDDLDAKKARPITSIEELPTPDSRENAWWPWMLGGAGLLFTTGLLIGLLWRTPPPRPSLRPQEWSLRQLDRLVERNLPEKNAAPVFLRILSMILRSFLEKELRIPARRVTSAELVTTLSRTHAVPPERLGSLRSLLEKADLIRFAGLTASASECRDLADQVRRFIESSPLPTAQSR